MSKYSIPNGYVLDPNTGLYYSQVIAYDAKNTPMQVVTWFNADTGEYKQQVYPIVNTGNVPTTTQGGKKKLVGLWATLIALFCFAIGFVISRSVGLYLNDGKADEASEVTSISKERTESADVWETPDRQGGEKYYDEASNEDFYLDDYNHAETGDYNGEIYYETEYYDEEYVGSSYADDDSAKAIVGIYADIEEYMDGFYAPVIEFYEDGVFYINLNFAEWMNSYEGTYTTSVSSNGDVNVYLTFKNPSNGIPSTATVCFYREDDFERCYFLDEGFGLMGYNDCPYCFERY